MAWSILNSGSANDPGGGASISIAGFDIPSGTKLVYVELPHRSGTISGVTVNGVAATQAALETGIVGFSGVHDVWYLFDPTPATGITITATFSSNGFDNLIYAAAVSEIDTAVAPVVRKTVGDGAGNPAIVDTYTPTNGGSALFVSFCGRGTEVPFGSYGAGWTEQWEDNTGTAGTLGLADVAGMVATKTAADPAAEETFSVTSGIGEEYSLIWAEFAVASGATDATATPSGVSAMAAIGSVTALDVQTAPPTGVSATASVGTVTTKSDATVAQDGLAAAASVGSVSLLLDSAIALTGLAATASVGTVTAASSTAQVAAVSGVEATAQVGSVSVLNDMTVQPQGLVATAAVGSVFEDEDVSGISAGAGVGSGKVGTGTVGTENVWRALA